MASKIVKRILDSTRVKPLNLPTETPLGSPGYDNIREDLEKTKTLREGTVEKVPVDNNDIANKAYVDSVGGGSIRLDEVNNPNTNKTFSMANKGIAFDFTNPTGAGGGFDGAFNIEANGAFTGDLLHLHQHTGNPGAGTHVLHCEAVDSDVIPIGITSTHATGIDMGTSKIVGLVDPTSDQEAATKKYVDDNDADTTDHTALSNIGTNTHAQIDTSITATGLNTTHRSSDGSDHSLSHAESHDIASHSDTTATGAELDTLTGGGDTTLHDHDGISENTSARHTQGTDTTLGSGAVAADHGTAATDEIINVSYGTGSPPTANTTTIGSLFVKYTA